jgi:biotin operon repressor
MPRLSAKNKIKQFLLSNIGRTVSGKKLEEVAGISEWARRIRELRNEEGWKILTHTDDLSLKVGEYKLAERPPENYRFTRNISNRLRAEVLERNGYTCQMCGIGAGEEEPETGRKARLHLGHIIDKDHGGKDVASNLRALCSRCNEGAKNIAQEPPSWSWLLAQLRRASISDQRQALDWLKQKFHD